MYSRILGRYKLLVVAIIVFIILDTGVLFLNFYTAKKIAEHTERIDLGARQRTLTQQMIRSALYIWVQKLENRPYQSGVEDLRSAHHLFDQTLRAPEWVRNE